MAKYKILAIAHALKNNVIAYHGEVVDESQLTAPAYELVKENFISLVGDEVSEKESQKKSDDGSSDKKSPTKEEIKNKLRQEKK
jgi:hypothetical protein